MLQGQPEAWAVRSGSGPMMQSRNHPANLAAKNAWYLKGYILQARAAKQEDNPMNKAIYGTWMGPLLYTCRTSPTPPTPRCGRPAWRSESGGGSHLVGNGAIQQMRAGLLGDRKIFRRSWPAYRAYYPQHCNETTRPYAGILDTATGAVGGGSGLAIVSNKPDNATKALWKPISPPSTWPAGEGPDLPRPAPDMVLRALGSWNPLGRPFIGDSRSDVATARAAGIPPSPPAGATEYEEELLAAGAVTLPDPRDIPAALEELRHGQ